MKKKPYVGMRVKALLAVVLLILLPYLFLGVLTYHVRDEAVREVGENTIEEMKKEIERNTLGLNRNATDCIEKYIKIIENEGKSAGNDLKYHLGMNYTLKDTLWYSKDLINQINYTMLSDIINGSISNPYYEKMVEIAGKDEVDAVLRLFFQPLELNYSSPYINDTLHTALRDLNTALIEGGENTALFAFFHSILLSEPEKELDYILPVGNMLHSFRDEIPDLLWTYFADADSGFTVLISSGKNVTLPPLFNSYVRPWYLDAVEEGKPTWSETYVDSISGMPMTTYSVPVYGGSGHLIGVLGFDLLLSTLTKKTREFYTSNTSFAFIVSNEGTALAYPDSRVLGNSLIDGNTEFNLTVKEILNSTMGQTYTNLHGKRAFIAYSTVESTGWRFVNVVYCEELFKSAEKSAEEVGNIVNEEIMYILSIILAVGLIAFVTTFFLVDSSAREIERLTKIANEVSRGNLDINVEVDGKDEIGELQKAMKRMVNSIKIAMEELERRGK